VRGLARCDRLKTSRTVAGHVHIALRVFREVEVYEESHAKLALVGGADDEEIRDAFRRLALVTHPDHDGSVGAATRMRSLIDARDVLLGRYEQRVPMAFGDFARSVCAQGPGSVDEAVARDLARLINQDDDASVYIRGACSDGSRPKTGPDPGS
jgi:hypothetical protein